MNKITINPTVLKKTQRYAEENEINLTEYIEKQLKSLYIQEELFGKERKNRDITILFEN